MSVEKDFFLENFSLLLRAAMPVTEALDSLKQEIRSGEMRKTISVIEEEIASGSNISSALDKSALLSKRYIALLRIGEETGRFSDQLALIIASKKKEKLFQGKILNALIYPAFVLGVTFIVSIAVMWYVFPKLIPIFQSAGGTLPITTQAIIAIGNFFTSYGLVAVPAFLILVGIAFFFLFIFHKTRFTGEVLLLHTPVAKTIIQDIELARFGYGMGTLLRAGVPLPQALESMRDSTTFILYTRFYAGVLARIDEGNSLYKSISGYPGYTAYMPSYIARLLLAGELSGSLSDTLIRVSEEYDQKVEGLTQNLSALLEPVIIVTVGLIVAVIALGVISPIYGLANQIQ